MPFDPTALSKARAKRIYTTKAKALYDVAQANSLPAIPQVHPSGPTKTYETSTSLTGRSIQPNCTDTFTAFGAVTNYNLANNYLANWYDVPGHDGDAGWGVEFGFYGDAVEINWRANSSANQEFWVWVDGMPLTAMPEAPGSLTTVAASQYTTKLVFGSAGFYRVRFYGKSWSLRSIGCDATDVVIPTPRQPWSVAVIGDSYSAQANGVGALSTFPQQLGVLLGAELFQGGQGGTGYTSPGSGNLSGFTNAERLGAIADATPDLVVFFGSVNDDGDAGIQTAAASAYSQLASLLPTTPVIVIGPPPSNAGDTIAANRASNIAAVRAAAVAASNVVGFVDATGIEAGTAGWSNQTAYGVGTKVHYEGGVYRCIVAVTGAGTPKASSNWERVSWLAGEGHAGNPTGSGDRDVLLSNDSIHWTTAGHRVLARLMKDAIISTLRAAAYP